MNPTQHSVLESNHKHVRINSIFRNKKRKLSKGHVCVSTSSTVTLKNVKPKSPSQLQQQTKTQKVPKIVPSTPSTITLQDDTTVSLIQLPCNTEDCIRCTNLSRAEEAELLELELDFVTIDKKSGFMRLLYVENESNIEQPKLNEYAQKHFRQCIYGMAFLGWFVDNKYVALSVKQAQIFMNAYENEQTGVTVSTE